MISPEKIKETFGKSSLYSDDLAPVPAHKRTWNTWHLAALWVGMAVCIPTYLLASFMIKSGLSWVEALLIIGLANVVITLPMALNGHAGVKYGIPFPVVGRSTFGIHGIHFPSLLRGIVACGWFGVQTWIGGLAFYAIWLAITGGTAEAGLSIGKFVGFGLFWIVNMYFVWKGTESIRWLEEYAAPILILMGIVLIGWGAWRADGFSIVLQQSSQLSGTSAWIESSGDSTLVKLAPLVHKDGTTTKAGFFAVSTQKSSVETNPEWKPVKSEVWLSGKHDQVYVQFMEHLPTGTAKSSIITASIKQPTPAGQKIWSYILWFTAMVGFWATMSISISDITRFATSQKAQISGQFIGLPGTMMLYSFVGIFVTCAAIINFDDILIPEDAPWDPVTLLSRFQNPVVVVIAQLFMIIATLSTNIAANVIAPANAFANLLPKQLDFKKGGIVTGIIGIIICPWWLMDEISNFLIIISGILGPVLGVLLADYFVVRKKELNISELFNEQGIYRYTSGFYIPAFVALSIGMASALIGLLIPSLRFLYDLSWFTGFGVSFFIHSLLARNSKILPTKS